MKRINVKYKYSELTSRIIRYAMEVHKILGNGFREFIYQGALVLEFKRLMNKRFQSPSQNHKNQSLRQWVGKVGERLVEIRLKHCGMNDPLNPPERVILGQ